MRGGCLITVVVLVGCDCYSMRPGGPDEPGLEGRDAASGEDARPPDAGADASPRDASQTGDAGGDGGVAVSDPIRLDEGDYAHHPRVAMDADANAAVVWAQTDGVVARRWQADVGWTDAEALGPGDEARVDLNARGEGVALWRDMGGAATHARMWAPGAGWLVDDEIGPGDGPGEIVIDGSGNAVAVFNWGYAGERVESARYEPATGWTGSSPVEPEGVVARMAVVAGNERGDVVGVWTHLLGEGESLWSARWEDGAWPPSTQVGSQDLIAYPRVAVDGAGNAFAVWPNYDYYGGGPAIWTSRQEPGGDFGEPEYLGAGDGTISVAVAAASDGTAFAAWESGTDVVAARWEPVGGWGEIQNLDGRPGKTDLYEAIEVAADDAGGARVVWSQDEEGGLGIWSSRYRAGEGWLDPLRVDPSEEGDASWPDVDVAPDGTAAVVWQLARARDEMEIWGAILAP